jgi:hypothetical protein
MHRIHLAQQHSTLQSIHGTHDRELQHHKNGVIYWVPLAQEKIKIQNNKFEAWFLLNAYHFCTTVNLKDPKSNPAKSATKFVSYFHSLLNFRDF